MYIKQAWQFVWNCRYVIMYGYMTLFWIGAFLACFWFAEQVLKYPVPELSVGFIGGVIWGIIAVQCYKAIMWAIKGFSEELKSFD